MSVPGPQSAHRDRRRWSLAVALLATGAQASPVAECRLHCAVESIAAARPRKIVAALAARNGYL